MSEERKSWLLRRRQPLTKGLTALLHVKVDPGKISSSTSCGLPLPYQRLSRRLFVSMGELDVWPTKSSQRNEVAALQGAGLDWAD